MKVLRATKKIEEENMANGEDWLPSREQDLAELCQMNSGFDTATSYTLFLNTEFFMQGDCYEAL